ncbi:type VII secretion protein EccCb, partial [Streptomyces sp. HC44]
GWAALHEGGGTAVRSVRSDWQLANYNGMLGIDNPSSLNLPALRSRPSPGDRLKVPIGVGEDGRPVLLDLKEGAQGGTGPHGILVGATGSGKSELLRTIVLGLAVRHSPEEVTFVLADFKGGAAFTGLADLPHVSGFITNLEGDPLLMARMQDAISGELHRRQELLRAAGLPAFHEYEKARASRDDLEPMPALVLVIDEFSELLVAQPDFQDLFVLIGRLGRSLGVHLLLASQRLEEGSLRGVDTYLSYRIGLRVFSASESRAVLGYPDAYHLPSAPGAGFLKANTTDVLVRFKASYVSAPLPNADNTDDSTSLMEVVVGQLSATEPPARRIWLPPLRQPRSAEGLFPNDLTTTTERGLHAPGLPPWAQPLRAPYAVADDPFNQQFSVCLIDASGAEGHSLIVGGPQSGKSTLLATLVTSFALTHTPQEAQFYCLDFGGGRLEPLARLPHVGGVSSRLEADRVRRTVADVARVLAEREEFFRTHGIESIATYRRRRAAGEWPDQPWGDVFLVIDGWATFRTDYEALEPVITDIAQRGLSYGVHLLISASRHGEVRASMRDQLLGRIELRLSDPTESEIDRKLASYVPLGAPGRGLSHDKLHFLTAVPKFENDAEGELLDQTGRLVESVRKHWTGPEAPPVRTLPELVPVDELPGPDQAPGRTVAIGIDDSSLAPVFLDFETDPLFLVFGDSESGKSSFLRLLAHQVCTRLSPDKAQLIAVDYRRSLLGEIPEEHILSYCPSGPPVADVINQLAGVLHDRMPGPDVTAEQLRNRSWYQGKDVYLLVDDYDLVSTSTGNPLTPLLEYLPFARDLGLRVVLARSTAGASRSTYEPFMQRMKDLGGQGLVLSGDRSEGALLGAVKPSHQPPGRGTLVTRRSTLGVQLGYLPPRST